MSKCKYTTSRASIDISRRDFEAPCLSFSSTILEPAISPPLPTLDNVLIILYKCSSFVILMLWRCLVISEVLCLRELLLMLRFLERYLINDLPYIG